MSKTILVTGGLGYIGSHTVVELQQSGYNVVVVDDLSNSSRTVEDRIKEISGKTFKTVILDITNTEKLKKIFEQESIDGVIHFAAFKAVGESVEFPLKYYKNNVGGMISLLDCMKEFKVNPMVFSSSCTVYGDTKDSPIKENHPVVEAISPYGTTKIICEQLLKDLCNHSPITGISLRYFNPVGAHPSALIGELPIGIPSNLVPYITQTAAGIRKQLTVFGSDYNTLDGTNVRDFIHVSDLAKAHVKAIDFAFNTSAKYETFNLGTGKGNSVLEVIKSFETVTGERLNYKLGDRRPGDVEQIWADASKAEDILNWSCEFDLDQMMKTAWEWQMTMKRLGLNQ